MELLGYDATADGRLDATFAALADPTRRAILARLAAGEASVAELAAPFAMTQPAISKHLKVLERAGLISRRKDRQRRPCRLEARPLAEATGWLVGYRQFWEQSFQGLDALLEELKALEAAQAAPASAPTPANAPGQSTPAQAAPGQSTPARAAPDQGAPSSAHPASDPRSDYPCLDR
jgi:DNA-binding transcriptional ArsR family regulator